jgi:4-hydroxybenzoate polyprenyltransferase
MNDRHANISKKAKAWFQLLRLPNLFTVPGDPIAGYLLSLHATCSPRHSQLILLSGISLLLYAAGLITNDIADRKEDAMERPTRPLPSGRIPVSSAWVTAIAFMTTGVALSFVLTTKTFLVVCALCSFILTYNFSPLKKHTFAGPFCMGLCRGLNLLLGASIIGLNAQALTAAIIITLYITVVTSIATKETKTLQQGLISQWGPFSVILSGFLLFILFTTPSKTLIPAYVILFFTATNTVYIARRLGRNLSPTRTPSFIGKYIQNLIIIQASFCALSVPNGIWYSLALIVCFPISIQCARHFYAS